MKMPLPFSMAQMEGWIKKTVRKNPHKQARIRVTITRGLNSFNFMNVKKPTVCITVKKNRGWPKDYYKKGIKIITSPLERTFPAVKTTSLIANTLAQQEMTKRGCQEAIFVNRYGNVTEGTTSNVFFVKKNTLLFPADQTL